MAKHKTNRYEFIVVSEIIYTKIKENSNGCPSGISQIALKVNTFRNCHWSLVIPKNDSYHQHSALLKAIKIKYMQNHDMGKIRK